MFDFIIGLGQGGGRLAQAFGKSFDISTVLMNLAGVDFSNIDSSSKNVLVFEEGGTGRSPGFGEAVVRSRIEDLFDFLLNKQSYENAKHILICIGGGGGAGSGFLFPVLEILQKDKKDIFLIYTLPEKREGVPTKPNSLEILDRLIQEYVRKNKISILLVDNDYCVGRYGSGTGFDYWGSVNTGIVTSLKRFWVLTDLSKFSNIIDVASGYKALDKNDIRRILFSKSGYTDIRMMVFNKPEDTALARHIRESSLLFGSLDLRTAKKYIVSIGIPESWKRHIKTLEFVEAIFQAVSKATRHTPDVLRCSYFNKKLTNMQVHILASGMSKGKGIDKMIRGTEKDIAVLNSKEKVQRLDIKNI
jgi:cell division GTPase FtsZ